jgi:signal transduction histidine kinase/CheY-like chemotaxis protein
MPTTQYFTFAEETEKMLVMLTALVFNIILLIAIYVFNSDKKKDSHTGWFRNLVMSVAMGSILTILAGYARNTQFWMSYPKFSLLLVLLEYAFNLILTYSFAKYMEVIAFSDLERKKKHFLTLRLVNLVFLTVTLLFILGVFIAKVPNAVGTSKESISVSTATRLYIGFAVDLYFLVYAIVMFAVRNKTFDKRAKITTVAGLIVTIAGIMIEIWNKTHIVMNYPGAVLGLYIFYFGIENSDYKNLSVAMSELVEAKRHAEEANTAKSDFLANMSHEIRTPINAILGMNEMIIRESKDDDTLLCAKNIESAGHSLLSIINDILDFSKIESGKIDFVNAPYKLSSVLNDVVNMTNIRAKEKKLEFETYVNENLPDELYGDEMRIRKIMVNLLGNAVKYTKSGYVKLCVDGTRRDDVIDLEIKVEDTGIGIRPEDMDKVFSRFNRAADNEVRNIEGTGLGLTITKSLTEIMGGSISVDSTYGEGSVFTAVIPQRVCSEDVIGDFRERFKESIKEKSSRESIIAPNAKLLVVDDNIVNLMVVKGLLKNTQMRVATAESGKDALKALANEKFDLIFLDQRMPELSGTETLRRMKRIPGFDTPVICLTADAVLGAKESYLNEGFDGYLSKPIETAQMNDVLKEFLPKTLIRVETD